MVIDFSKISNNKSVDTILSPREIFMALPQKDEKYKYPRDVQTEVWNKWFEQRENKDNVIKMNTGSGKTIVGLLILKSCLNENKGPAVFVVPDQYLVNQVICEARNLGLTVTDNEEDVSFLRGKSILVMNVHKLINGYSVFGMRQGRENIKIGSVIIDDVHACLNTTESQFTIEINSNDNKYNSIFNIFKEDLANQSDTKVLDLCDNVPFTNMLVPFWSWQKKIEDVISILHKGKEDNDIKFTWPLLKDSIRLCNCVISTEKIEITPKSIPIHKISSFFNANRRIFMSATLSDDSILVSHFGMDLDNLKEVITPSKSGDIGDRLILVPQEINPDIEDEEMKLKIKELSLKYNTVVIVPSTYRAGFWEDCADYIWHSKDLHNGVNLLKSKHVGLVVLVNKYDGIDLPEDACRILVIDTLPDTRSEYDKIEQGALLQSDRIINNKIQRIEQGMGRGVRSNTDYCFVLLMGKNLINNLYVNGAIEKFSSATKEQINLSEKVSEQVRGKNLNDIIDVSNYILDRNNEWVTVSKSALINLEYNNKLSIKPLTIVYRQAFELGENRDYVSASKIINDFINDTEDKHLKGWLKQHLAEYTNFFNPVQAQIILKSALADNIQVLKPIEGIQYEKNLKKFRGQAQQLIDYIRDTNLNENKYILKVNALLDELVFKPDTANVFENAFKDLAYLLGFTASRPEHDFGRGPDVLWMVGEQKFFVIECKNGSSSKIIDKHDCNQLNGSTEWFKKEYDTTIYDSIPMMIHPSNTFEFDCSPNENIKIMDNEKLKELREHFLSFSKAIVVNGIFNNIEAINKLLLELKLDRNSFANMYTKEFRINKKR